MPVIMCTGFSHLVHGRKRYNERPDPTPLIFIGDPIDIWALHIGLTYCKVSGNWLSS
jgi:hypothetical protein